MTGAPTEATNVKTFVTSGGESLRDFAALDRRSFETPWSARAFGVTLAAAEAGLFSLNEFQRALIGRIGAHEQAGQSIDSDEAYYGCWIGALVDLLSAKGLIRSDALATAEEGIRAALREMHSHEHDHHPRPVRIDAGR